MDLSPAGARRNASRKVSIACFDSAADFRDWLERHHSTAVELCVCFFNRASGRGGITYLEALDEALCYGWIDGVRSRVDLTRYSIRFSPRKPRSIWSLVNVRNAERLIADGRMRDAGLKAFMARENKKTGVYSFGRRPEKLPAALERVFRTNKKAWAFWCEQPPGYRRIFIGWVISAVKDETRRRRLERIIGASGDGRRLDPLTMK
jgi:uncharacterized protein YdeI (YjbR/CyaY-like superfamily)